MNDWINHFCRLQNGIKIETMQMFWRIIKPFKTDNEMKSLALKHLILL